MNPSSIKTVVVTGASSGFGWAICEHFASLQFQVMMGARRLEKMHSLIHQSAHSQNLHAHELDVRSPQSIASFKTWVDSKTSQVDVLVNNAGLALQKDSIETAQRSDWLTMWETNVLGVMHMSQIFLPSFFRQKFGHIVNIGSISSEETYAGGGGYCSSKFGLRALTKSLRLETLGKNIRVSQIDPGMAETEFSLVRFSGDATKAKNIYAGVTPLTAKDIALAVAYVVQCPPHVNIDEVRMTPIQQADAMNIYRQTAS